MTTLTKFKNITIVPGSPPTDTTSAVPGTSGSPGSPGKPAYTETKTVTTPTYKTVTFVDTNGVHTVLVQTGSTTTTSYIYHPAVPPVPPVPPVPGSPGTPGAPGTKTQFLADNNIGWNAGAVSIKTLEGDGYLTFTASASAIGEVVGLAYNDAKGDYFAIGYGLYLTKGSVAVVESGSIKTSIAYATGDTLRVQRLFGVVTYSVNGATFYVSSHNSPSQLGMAAASALYAAGDSVLAAALYSSDDADLYAATNTPVVVFGKAGAAFITDYLGGQGSAGNLHELTGFGAQSTFAQSLGSLRPLEGSGSQLAVVGAITSMLPLTGIGANYGYQYSTSSMLPLTGSGFSGRLAPNYGLGNSTMWPLQGWSHGLTGELGHGNTVMFPIKGFGSDHNYAEGRGTFEPLVSIGGVYILIDGLADLTLTGGYQLDASGSMSIADAFHGTLPMGTLQAYCGSWAKMAMPMGAVTCSGTGTAVGRAALTMPMGALMASGQGGATAAANLTLPSPYAVQAYSGALLSVTLQDGFVLTATGSTGTLGHATLTLPLFELVASGTVNELSSANLTMPMLAPVTSGAATLTLPAGYRLVAAGTATVAVTYEGYAVNLKSADGEPNQATHYPNYPFNQIVRFNGNYYGVASDGLYLLDGDFDAGAPIDWKWETCLSDFGAREYKRVPSAYLGGRIDGEIDVEVILGEKSDQQYHYRAVRGADAQSYRVKIGRGLKARYWGFGAADPGGSFFEIDTFEPREEKLERSI